MSKREICNIIDILFERMCKEIDKDNLLITYGKLIAYMDLLCSEYVYYSKLRTAIGKVFDSKYVELSIDI